MQMYAKKYEETHPKENTNAGKNCLSRRKWLRDTCWSKIQGRNERCTRLIPLPSVADNVNRMWTVGSNHLINLSLPLWNVLKARACLWYTFIMVSGVLQTSNTAANRWVCRSFLVSFLYSSKAVLNMSVKLDVEVHIVWLSLDMMGGWRHNCWGYLDLWVWLGDVIMGWESEVVNCI